MEADKRLKELEDGSQLIDVLDKGYVRLVDHMGTDLSVVNSARVSYDKQKSEMEQRDEGLVSYLAREGHSSPFRHATLQFEVYAPLMVARQWWKYVIGGSHQMDAWNESSRRYITEEPVFHVPDNNEWRSKPENSKQGSGPVVEQGIGVQLTENLAQHVDNSLRIYEDALANGVAPEQARLFLPAYGMYVRWYWTASLQSVAHFLSQRLENDAQKEIQEYAQAVEYFARDNYPVATKELLK